MLSHWGVCSEGLEGGGQIVVLGFDQLLSVGPVFIITLKIGRLFMAALFHNMNERVCCGLAESA
jgi:hypothetical protein